MAGRNGESHESILFKFSVLREVVNFSTPETSRQPLVVVYDAQLTQSYHSIGEDKIQGMRITDHEA